MYVESGIFGSLYIISLCINKFILTTLEFSYPTIFQSWQTVCSSFILGCIRYKSYFIKDLTYNQGYVITRKNFHLFLIDVFLHLTTILMASKALTLIPIPFFVVVQNSSMLLNQLYANKNIEVFEFMAATSGLITTLMIFVLHGSSISLNGKFYLSIFLISRFISYSTTQEEKTYQKELDKLFYKNTLSFMILAPLSVYIADFYRVFEYPSLNSSKFIYILILSGFLGSTYQIMGVVISKRKYASLITTVIRIPAILISLLIFGNSGLLTIWHLISLHFLASLIFMTAIESSNIEINSSIAAVQV